AAQSPTQRPLAGSHTRPCSGSHRMSSRTCPSLSHSFETSPSHSPASGTHITQPSAGAQAAGHGVASRTAPASSQVSAMSPSQVIWPGVHCGSGAPVVLVWLSMVTCPRDPSVVSGAPVVGGPVVVGALVEPGSGAPVELASSVVVAAAVAAVAAGGDSSPLHASAPSIATPPPTSRAHARPNRIAETVSPPRIWC